jgi:hypothetical protein
MNTPPRKITTRPSSGAALIIVLAFIVLLTVLVVSYFSRSATDQQLAQSSFNDTSANLLSRSALDIVVSDFKQEIASGQPVTATNIQPQRSGDDQSIPNLIRRSVRNDAIPAPAVSSLASAVPSTSASANGRSVSLARWNSHYLIPPTGNFTAPDWVLVTAQGPNPAPPPNAVIGRYAYAVYDEGGLIDINIGGFPTYASLTPPTRRSTHRLVAKYPSEESEIILCAGVPSLNPNQSGSGIVGSPVSFSPKWKQGPTSYGYTGSLPAGLSLSPATGVITGTPSRSGTYNVTLTATNGSGTGSGTFPIGITGAAEAAATPWPVNLARKGIVGFADLSVLPSNPAITSTQINQIMGWRNHATTQQLAASFDNPAPSFPPDLTHEEYYAKYLLGPGGSFTTPFTTVSTAVVSGRTDQAVMSRQELIKLQRTIGFSQNLLQYLGTFSREQNRPAPNWPQLSGTLAAARYDMNNLAIMLPDPFYNKHGNGHAYGRFKHTAIGALFGLKWVDGITTDPSTGLPITRTSDPRYYGHWQYIGHLKDNPGGPLHGGNPDFFQIIDYAMNQAIGVNNPNHLRNTFYVGAALVDQYDTDDVDDGVTGNTITIIDYDGNTANWAYGIENMSYDDPAVNLSRPPFAQYPTPLPAGYVFLNRRFENAGEFGYAYNPASTTASKTLDFASSTSNARAMLDFFTYNTATPRAGIVNLNTRNGPVLASIISGALLHDPGSENTPTLAGLVIQQDALTTGQAIVAATTAAGGAVLNRADVARLAAAPGMPASITASDETKQTIARTLAEVGQARTWNLMIDVIAQTGKYAPGTTDLTDPTKFIVQGEKRYWLHIALDRDSGTVLGQQLEEVTE